MVNIDNLEILNSIILYLKKVNEKYPIKNAYLYGSYANGNFSKDSDIDLAIISEKFSGNRFEDNVAAGVLTWGIDTRIEPITFIPQEFNDDNLLASEILLKGIELKKFVQ